MSALSRSSLLVRATSGAVAAKSFAPSSFTYGRTPAYRRLHQLQHTRRSLWPHLAPQDAVAPAILSPARVALTSKLLPESLAPKSSFPSPRQFHVRSSQLQEARPQEDIKDPPRQENSAPDASAKSESSSSGDGAKEEPQQETKEEGKEEGESKEESKKEDAPPPPPHGDKSPWQVFTDTLKSEFKASKEWNESTKALASSAHEFTQNETLKRARSAYGAASGAATSTTAKALKSTGKVIGQSAAWTWDTTPVKGIRASVNATGRGIEKITRPVRQTEAFKTVRDVIDDGSSTRYGGWMEKEQRKKIRESREMQEAARGGRPGRVHEKMEEDPDAGTNVTLHKDAAWKESWRQFRDSSRVMQSIFSLKSTYNESENPLISTARSISDRVAGFFAENETAMVIKKFREMDPGFQLEPFLQDMREYILPEVLDAYVKGDVETLKLWLSAAQFQVYSALMHQYTTAGLKSDGRILDIRNVDVLSARMLDPGEIPVFILTCRTQEVHVYRNTKSGELAAGMEDRVQQVTYAIGVTRIPEDVNNTETRGWRLIELQKSARDYM